MQLNACEAGGPEPQAANDVLGPARPSPTGPEVLQRLEGLIRRIGEGDEPAMEALYRETVHGVHAVAYRIARNRETAEEAVSDTYFQVWRTARSYDPARGNVMAYLTTIVRSRVLDLLRRGDPAIPYGDLHPGNDVDCGPTPEESVLSMQEGRAVQAALGALPPLQRQLVALAFVQGQSHSEIASQFNMPLGTVKTLIRRTLLGLRKDLRHAGLAGD
ncbi:hypothetical protein BWI17_21295 [Betaproteobacteria bacterium GR16-43]|nr:hypothetical protein BWI17_21295 [Betaproteobacteria bacterium GR16-43]